MFRHLLEANWCRFVAGSVDCAVHISGCAPGVGAQLTLVLNLNYFIWCIGHFTNVLIFRKVYVNLIDVGDGDVDSVAMVDVHDTFGRSVRMWFGRFVMRKYLYYAYCIVETNTGVSPIAFCTTCLAVVILLGSRWLGTTNAASFSSTSWREAEFSLTTILSATCTIQMDTGKERCGTIFLLPGWMYLIARSKHSVLNNTRKVSLPTTRNTTRTHNSPIQRLRWLYRTQSTFCMTHFRLMAYYFAGYCPAISGPGHPLEIDLSAHQYRRHK